MESLFGKEEGGGELEQGGAGTGAGAGPGSSAAAKKASGGGGGGARFGPVFSVPGDVDDDGLAGEGIGDDDDDDDDGDGVVMVREFGHFSNMSLSLSPALGDISQLNEKIQT